MNQNTISFAEWGMQSELAKIWQVCFQEQKRSIQFFFNNSFQPKNCLVYKNSNKIVAMVHLLPAQIQQNNKRINAHYIYAAATLPQYQKCGYMRELLHEAHIVAERRGDEYSFLLPANRSLYHYYGKIGYIPGFELRTLLLPQSEMQKAAKYGQKNNVLLNYSQISSIRKQYLRQQTGSVIWNAKEICYADGINKIYGGRLICSNTKNQFSYAFCRMLSADKCEITEIMADENTFPNLAANILNYMPAQTYKLRLSNNDRLFNKQGKIFRFGMAKPIGKANYRNIMNDWHNAYLGLTLD